MTARHFILALAGVAAFAIPYAASAQPDQRLPDDGGQPNYAQPQADYGGAPNYAPPPQGGYGGGPNYSQPPAGYDSGERPGSDWGRRFPGYPEFREREAHIRDRIWRSVREDMIAPEDAHGLMEQLHHIQWEEQREFQDLGWNLPDSMRQRIHFELEQLDHQIDQMRQER
jgi:hypothetical protein